MNPISSNLTFASSFAVNFVISFPSNTTVPLVGTSIPDTAYSNVDFPEPEGPMIATISPSFT